ncbi:FHA domain-containing protein [Kribbella solani]|uniref:FHA domain-containing protein n=1 Tax=Kribbella solani TaxID=236067 RepID=UPI0029B139E3|nr:FHA domain-containing protein [Kribbella solani]MDX2972028.1 FHA domain-containing protein [Kribbella solani]MDX3000359.1 FHA domain-containing protein [Kribbella solani]
MEPVSGFVRAVVGDVAFIFGKGVVNAYLLARRRGVPRPQLDVLVRSHGQYVPLSVPVGTVPAIGRLVGLDEIRPAPMLTVEFTPGDTGAEAHLTANNPVLITITDVSHREYDAIVLTTTLGSAAYAQLPPGYYHVSVVVVDERNDLLQAYGAQHNLHVDKGDDLIVSMPIRTAGVTEIAAALETGPQPVLVGPDGDVVPVLDLVRIGRAPDCDLILDRPEISRHHAELLRIDPTSYELRDLGSTNGTQLNGVPVDTAMAGDGDEIRLGGVPFRLYVG